ncbi:MAG: glycosyltransferase [Gammaproteobacteria bacterium HGW-Gammaproteobacteria-3]|nr:MAG: glycosyltransferase [Gammaproteobacteria bacterium HGW-Gammaproteobacteria-3]
MKQRIQPTASPDKARHLSLFMPSLAGGGVERVMLNLAKAFAARGHRVDMVVCRAKGELRDRIPDGITLVELQQSASRVWPRLQVLRADPKGFWVLLKPVLFAIRTPYKIRYLASLVRYLRRASPDVLLTAMTGPNLTALWARRLASVPTRVVISEHNSLSQKIQAETNRQQWGWRFLPPVISRTYPWANAIIAVSDGVADDLSAKTGLPRESIQTLYNPVVTPELEARRETTPDHPWFAQGSPPVILGVGRLAKQKDFSTLLRAFARVRESKDARLIILGEGSERKNLEALAQRLGVADAASFPGWVANPYAYMAQAKVLALSSAFEGLGNVLIEALACGCPVVSTDCPSGPSEILAGGDYGTLVPVGDDRALAQGIAAVLDKPRDSLRLQNRAQAFSLERAVSRYLEVLCGL